LTDSSSISLVVVVVLSWVLAEFFVLKKRMALPGIVLVLSFLSSVAVVSVALIDDAKAFPLMAAAGITTVAAYLHWWRFKVPITVASAAMSAVVCVVSVLAEVYPDALDKVAFLSFVFGLLLFVFAMYWDASDRSRTTHRSDVAFWIHLFSAPLIIHSVFSLLGVLDGNESLASLSGVVFLYFVMTLVSIAINRRALMLSSLGYVLYALSNIVSTYGSVSHSLSFAGVVMGGALLLLSIYWGAARAALVSALPNKVKAYIPEVS